MRLAVLFTMLSALAWGGLNPQIEPEAERLYHRASSALHQLPAYEMDVETVVARPHDEPGDGFHILAKLAVRQPDHILISGTTPFAGETTIYSDGRTSLLWEESTNQFAKLDAAIPASMVLRLTNLTPESEPFEQTLVSAKVIRREQLEIDGDSFDCTVIQVETTGRNGVEAAPRPHTLWIDNKTGVALRQQTGVVPPHLEKEIPASITVTRFHYGEQVGNSGFAFIVPADATEVDWRVLDTPLTSRGVVGLAAPAIHFTTVDGHTFDLARFRGKPVLLHFEAPWCEPCQEADSAIDNVAKTMASEVKVLHVSVEDPAATSRPHTLGITAADAESLGLKAWPANLLVSREGKVVSFEPGRASEAALLALLQNAASTNAAPPPQNWGAAEPRKKPHVAHSEVTPPELVYKVDPGYTAEAQRAKISGTVMLAILVGTDGHVTDIHVLEKLEPSLDARAITAVSKWRFTPAMRGTTPVAFLARAGVSFSQQ